MKAWRDRTKAYDRTAYVAGIMTTTLTCVSFSLFNIRADDVIIGLDLPEDGRDRCGIVVAGRF